MKFIEGWETKPLGAVIKDIGDGGTPNTNKKEYFGGSIPWVVIQDIKKNISETKTTLTQLGLDSCSAKLWPAESVILSTGATIGEVGIAKVPLATKQGIHGMVCDSELSSSFLYYKLQTLRDFLNANAQGSTIREVRAPFIRTIPITFPTAKPEQTKIAEVLSTVDRAIEQTEALIAKQQRIKTGLMQDLLTRGIDEHGNLRSEQTHEFKDSPLGRIPVEWKVGGFENYVVGVAGIKPGPFGSSLTKDMYSNAGYRVYGQEQVIGGSLNLGDYYIPERKFVTMESFAVRQGDVLISLVGTIGHVLIIPQDYEPGVINPRLLRFRPNPRRCLPAFLKALLLSQSVRMQLDSYATGGTMPVLSGSIIRKVKVFVVGYSEQERITQTLNGLEHACLSSSQHLSKLRSLKTALMQDLFTGKVRVTPLLAEPQEASA